MQPLYKDVKGNITKLATKEISDDPKKWVHEIKTYLFETAPYVGRYDLNVNFNRIDEKTGYGFGSVMISAGSQSSDRKVQIPFVIEERKLFPMDLIVVSGTIRPLTESRLSEALFRPQLLDEIVKQEDIKPTSAVEAFSSTVPPGRYGLGGPIVTKESSLLSAIKNTITKADLEKTAEYISADPSLRDRLFTNPATLKAIERLHEAELVEKTADLSTYIRPTIMQVTLTKDNKYKVKTANPKAFKEKEETLGRIQALAKLGSEVVRAVDNVGTLTVSTNAVVDRDKMEVKYASVEDNGIYKVVTLDGSPIKGIVFAKLAGLDGKSTEAKLFATNSEIAIQEEFSGEKLGNIQYDKLPDNNPNGLGVFYWDNYGTNGTVRATVPLIVHDMSKTAEETRYDVSTLLDESAFLIPSAVKDITKIGSEILIPKEAKFMALPGTAVLPLASVRDLEYRRGQDKTASVNIRHFNGRFSFKGSCGLDKIAHKEDLGWDEAVFLASCLGMNPDFAETKLAQAVKHASGTTIRGLTEIKPLTDYVEEAREKLAAVKDPLSTYMDKIRQNLWKEAAAIEDEETVDKILSLNYITPENIKTFVQYLPSLEAAQRKLCELLLASRIGLKEIDEMGLTSTIQGVEKALTGLKTLLHTQE